MVPTVGLDRVSGKGSVPGATEFRVLLPLANAGS
jgi:hypothetical protein